MNGQEAPRRTILLFGPQPLAFNQVSFNKLRANIVSSPALSWVPNTISELPGYWNTLCAEFPKLRIVSGTVLLRNLNEWIDTGSLESLPTLPYLPNIVLTPLCVISQLAAYTQYLRLGYTGSKQLQDAEVRLLANTETTGFCTGILAALAVSSSATHAELEHHGGIAVRLAMLVGAIVDSQDALAGESKSFSAVWRTPNEFRKLEEILNSHPEVGHPILN